MVSFGVEARAESGTVHAASGAGLSVQYDTRWVSGPGYRPVRITLTPTAPVIADRTLSVEFSASRYWDYDRSSLRVFQDIEIPAGSGVIEATMSVPQTVGWNRYTINVVENGKLVRPLCQSGVGDSYASWSWEEKFPKILFAGDKLPDTSGIAALLNVADSYQYGAMYGSGKAGSAAEKVQLPTAISRPVAELPTRWIDYTNLDILCVRLDDLTVLSEKRPEAFQAIVDWTFAGGNLCVYGVGEDWGALGAKGDMRIFPGDSGGVPGKNAPVPFSAPDPKLFGRPLRNLGSNVGDPASAMPFPASADVGVPPYGPAPVQKAPEAARPDPDVAPGQVQQSETFHFVFRPANMGMIVAIAEDDPFALRFRQSTFGWSWLLNSIGAPRFSWCQRHGLSATRENGEFWNFLIPGVGLAPVTGFRVLITLFVLAIGPLNYYLLRRCRSLHLLVVTVPLSAAAVSLALFAYALLADGLGTRVRVRSVTAIDQQAGHAACWARQSYYAGLAPLGGLRFPDDVAVIPLEPLPTATQTGTAELIWEGDQRLTRGWLRSRTPTQYLTIRSRPSELGLTVRESSGTAAEAEVENRLGSSIEQLVVRGKSGRFYWAAEVAAGAKVQARAISPEEAKKRLDPTFRACEPRYPPGMERQGRNGYSSWSSYRRSWMWMSNQADLLPTTLRTSLLESWLGAARNAALEPGSYAAIVERSSEVVLGTPPAREEASLHVIVGTW